MTFSSSAAIPAPLAILPINGGRDLRRFLKLPLSLYADDPAWVPSLLIERRHHLSPRNPFFAHARWQGWLAVREERPVGRISAQIDHLHLQRYGDATGFFGLLEAQDDEQVFQALFATAEDWLRQQGMRRVRGPFDLSINDSCGLLVEGFAFPPTIMMGHALPYYAHQIETQGYAGVQDLLAYRIAVDFSTPPRLSALAARYAGRIALRPLRRGCFREDLAILREIFEDAWSENWGFIPFTTAEFEQLGLHLKLLVDEDLLRIAEVDGEPAAMMVVFPNLNEAIRDLNGRLLPFGWLKLLWRLKVAGVKTARVPLMGVRRRYQGSALGAALALRMIVDLQQPVRRRGMREAEMSWILAENKGMRSIIEALGGVSYKRYRLYEKEL